MSYLYNNKPKIIVKLPLHKYDYPTHIQDIEKEAKRLEHITHTAFKCLSIFLFVLAIALLIVVLAVM